MIAALPLALVLLTFATLSTAFESGDLQIWEAGTGRVYEPVLGVVSTFCPGKFNDKFSIRCYYPPGESAQGGQAGPVRFFINGKLVRSEYKWPYYLWANNLWKVYAWPYKTFIGNDKSFVVTCQLPDGSETSSTINFACLPPPVTDCITVDAKQHTQSGAGWSEVSDGMLYTPPTGTGGSLTYSINAPKTSFMACMLDVTGPSARLRMSTGIMLRAPGKDDIILGDDEFVTMVHPEPTSARGIFPVTKIGPTAYSVGSQFLRAGLAVTVQIQATDPVTIHRFACFPCMGTDCVKTSPTWDIGVGTCAP